MVMTPEFHTLGSSLPLGPRTTQPPEVVNEPRSYKALVMVFLAGGPGLSCGEVGEQMPCVGQLCIHVL